MSNTLSSTCDVAREPPVASRLLPMNRVLERISISKTQLYRLINAGEFPEPVPVGRQRIAFVESEVQAWIDQRIALRDADIGADERRARAIRAVGGRR